MNNERINEILGIKEAYELPDKLLKYVLANDDRIYDVFLEDEPDLNKDILNEYYQSEHGDRDKLKQDFTPNSLAYLVNCLAGEGRQVADICSGTGTLTINNWKLDKDKIYHLEEFSSRAIPVLLFNLAIRNMNAEVWHMDVLSREVFGVYEVKSGEKYSVVTKIEKEYATEKQDIVIMNPPYSIKWSGESDERFEGYGIAPKSKGDYAFILHGLNMLKEGGTLVAILPHGVLFRGAQEEQIRKKIIEKNQLDAVIGLPDKLFMNTGIPVCILILKKNRTSDKTIFIDASREFDKQGKNNILTDENIDKIIKAYKSNWEIKRYSEIKTIEDFRDNDFNLNIPRYVDTYIPEPVEPLDKLFAELVEIDKEIYETKKEIYTLFKDLVRTDGGSLEKEKRLLNIWTENKTGQLMMDL